MKMQKGITQFLPILGVMFLWGTMGVPSTYALEHFTPMGLLCVRSGVGAAVLFFWNRKMYGSILPDKREWKLLLLSSIIGVVLCNYFYFFALSHTTLTNTAILYATGPMLTAVLAAVFLKESIRTSRVAGILLAFVGVIALLTKGHFSEVLQIGFNSGDVSELVSALCLAVYTIIGKKIKNTRAECLVFWLMLIAFLITFPICFFSGGMTVGELNAKSLVSAVYLGIMCSGAGYLLQQISIRKVGAAASAAFLNGISPMTVLSAAVILREQISVIQVCSMSLIFFGLYLNVINRNIIK